MTRTGGVGGSVYVCAQQVWSAPIHKWQDTVETYVVIVIVCNELRNIVVAGFSLIYETIRC